MDIPSSVAISASDFPSRFFMRRIAASSGGNCASMISSRCAALTRSPGSQALGSLTRSAA